jgi:hypothetical protein
VNATPVTPLTNPLQVLDFQAGILSLTKERQATPHKSTGEALLIWIDYTRQSYLRAYFYKFRKGIEYIVIYIRAGA